MSTPRILLVEDDAQLGAQIVSHFQRAGFDCVWAQDGDEARRAPVGEVDLVVLDLMLPGTYGMDLLKLYRQRSEVPVMILSARDDSSDKVRALKLGADDYVTKPFGMDEFLARLRAAVRRGAAASDTDEPVIETDSFTVDLAAKKVSRNGAEVHLTPTEWGMLEMLARNRGKLVGREELLKEVWGPAYAKETHYLRVYLAQLRRKLEDDPSHPRHLLTEAGMGYRFEA